MAKVTPIPHPKLLRPQKTAASPTALKESAIADNYADRLLAQRGTISKDLDLEF